MRISERRRYETVQSRVERAKSHNVRQLDRLASQKDILTLSDDPIGATQSIKLRDNISGLEQFQKNIEYSQGFLRTSEESLQAITSALIRSKELAVAMANDTVDDEGRAATSREIKELHEELVQLANSDYSGRYVFAGFRSQTPPLSLDGDYNGDDGAIYMQVSKNAFRQVNLPARRLFEATPDEREAGHFNMLHTVEVLYDGLAANNKDMIQKALSELDFQLEKATSYQATLGGISKSLNDTAHRLNNEETVQRATLSKTEDADIYDASSEFKRTEAVLQGTLLASTKLLQPSLLNFLQ